MFHSATLTQYLNTVGAIPRLPSERDSTATKEELIEGNLRLVVAIARKRLTRTSEELLELIQDGNIGLILAAERYEPGKGSFGNYAGFHIRNCIAEGQITMSRTVRLPRQVFKNFRKITKLHTEGRTAIEIAEELDLYPPSVVAALSYEAESFHDAESPYGAPEDTTEKHLLAKRIKARLTPRQRSVVGRTLLGCSAGEIAEADGVSVSNVREAKADAVSKLKSDERGHRGAPPTGTEITCWIKKVVANTLRSCATPIYVKHVTMYLARQNLSLRFSEIGAMFSCTPHTAMYACKTIETKLSLNSAHGLRKDIETLNQLIERTRPC